MIGPEHERARPPSGPAFADAVTFAFGDAAARLYGLARIGLSPAGDGAAGSPPASSGSALAVLFSGREPVGAIARGGVPVAGDAGWDALSVGGLRATIEEPLARWRISMEGDGHGFDLRFAAVTPPAEIPGETGLARAGGMAGYEQLCVVEGTVRAGGRVHAIRCLGQRGHSWGEPDWGRIEVSRTISAWPDAGPALAFSSVRPVGAPHSDEPAWAALLDEEGTVEIDDPRLSTTYDADGRQRRAGFELWPAGEDAHPHRASGEVLCGSTLDLGQLRLDCAFFRWRVDGREGVGRYDVLRRAA